MYIPNVVFKNLYMLASNYCIPFSPTFIHITPSTVRFSSLSPNTFQFVQILTILEDLVQMSTFSLTQCRWNYLSPNLTSTGGIFGFLR